MRGGFKSHWSSSAGAAKGTPTLHSSMSRSKPPPPSTDGGGCSCSESALASFCAALEAVVADASNKKIALDKTSTLLMEKEREWAKERVELIDHVSSARPWGGRRRHVGIPWLACAKTQWPSCSNQASCSAFWCASRTRPTNARRGRVRVLGGATGTSR